MCLNNLLTSDGIIGITWNHIIIYFVFLSALHVVMLKWFKKHVKSQQHLSKLLEIKDAAIAINQGLMESEDVEILLEKVIEIAVNVMGKGSQGTIMLQRDGVMEVKAQIGFDQSIFEQLTLPIEDTLLYQYSGGDFTRAAILDADKDWSISDHYLTDVKAMISAPIVNQGNLVALINIYSKQSGAFTLEDLITAEYLCEQVKVVLKKHERYMTVLSNAKFDSLTGLFNRRHGVEVMEKHLGNLTNQITEHLLIMLDIDNLKPVNDQYGHDTGDRLIETFSSALRSSFKHATCICRYGGDEFVAMLPITETYNECYVDYCIDNLNEHVLNSPVYIQDKEICVTFSLGMAVSSEAGYHLSEMIQLADQRMYFEKYNNRNCI